MTNSTLQKTMFQAGAAFAGLAILSGAFATHELRPLLTEVDESTYETAVKYHMYHALALVFLGLGIRRIKENVAKTVFTLFTIGIFLFSGSLYLLSTSIIWAEERIAWLGGVTPIGGVAFIIGWLYLAFKGYKPSTSEQSNSGNKILEMHRRKKRPVE